MEVESINKFGLYKQPLDLYVMIYFIHDRIYSYVCHNYYFTKHNNLIKKAGAIVSSSDGIVLKVLSVIFVPLFVKIEVHKKLVLHIGRKRSLLRAFFYFGFNFLTVLTISLL